MSVHHEQASVWDPVNPALLTFGSAESADSDEFEFLLGSDNGEPDDRMSSLTAEPVG